MNSQFSIKRTQNLKEITARPNTGRPIEMHVNLRIGSALGQRSAASKRFFFIFILEIISTCG